MSLLAQIIFYTFLSGIVSLVGGVVLLGRIAWVRKTSLYFISFAAGALLSIAFLDLLPEALELYQGADDRGIFFWALIGLLLFFLFERLVVHIHGHYVEDSQSNTHAHPTPITMMMGDAFHNFLDGIAIAATFIADPSLGVLTAIGVAAHELPQEVSDFSVLIHHGWEKKKVLWINVIISLVSIVGAVTAYFFRELIEPHLPQLLALTAGGFIYIASSDLIPELSHKPKKDKRFAVTALLVAGVIIVYLFRHWFE